MRVFTTYRGKVVFGLLFGAAILCAQEGSREQGAPSKTGQEVPSVKGETAPAAAAVPAPVDPKTFSLGPEDIITIRVWREPDLSEQAAIRPDGMITMPLIGEIKAAGVTPERLGNDITEKLSKFINHPEVIVSVFQVRSKKYFITGEVNKPGAFPLAVPTTVLQALTEAGGFKEFANTKKIRVLRGSNTLKFNYKEVVKGKKMEQNILLENGDYIIVP